MQSELTLVKVPALKNGRNGNHPYDVIAVYNGQCKGRFTFDSRAFALSRMLASFATKGALTVYFVDGTPAKSQARPRKRVERKEEV